MNELHFFDGAEPDADARVPAGSSSPSPTHPYVGGLVAAGPRPRLRARASPTRSSTCVTAIAAGRRPAPSFADGLQVQRVLAAVERPRRRRAAGPRRGTHHRAAQDGRTNSTRS